jgi:hypothetical protein
MVHPNIWGKKGWIFLHMITVNYPDEPTIDDKKNYYLFFSQLKHVLPCNSCQLNFAQHWDKRPLTEQDLESRESLILWLIDIHNMANYQNGKKVLDVDEALDSIKNILNKNNHKNKKNNSSRECNNAIFYGILIGGIIVTIILITYLLVTRHGKSISSIDVNSANTANTTAFGLK